MLLAQNLYAETAYVNDRLFLGVYAEPDSTKKSIHTLSSGEQIETLEEQGQFVKVKTSNGVEGWARSRFISANKPPSVLIKEVEAERDKLIAQLNSTGADSSKEITNLKKQLQQESLSTKKIKAERDKLLTQLKNDTSVDFDQEIASLKEQLQQEKARSESFIVQIDELEKAKQTEPAVPLPNIASTGRDVEAAVDVKWYIISVFVCLVLGILAGWLTMASRVRKRFNGIKVW